MLIAELARYLCERSEQRETLSSLEHDFCLYYYETFYMHSNGNRRISIARSNQNLTKSIYKDNNQP